MSNVANRLEISKPMIVGGVPRDKILGKLKEISDLDITTGDKTVDFLSKEINIELGKNFSVKYKKANDGHTSIEFANLKIDFSSNFNTLNIEKYLSEKGIKNPTSMQKELFSRDFTCNTLLMDLDLKTISDPTGLALKDIKEKKIRTCLDPEITLKEKNRIIRSIYLAAKLGFEIDGQIIDWVRKNPDFIKLSSNKSLEEKLDKAMSYDAQKTIHLLKEMNLNNYVPIAEKVYSYYKD
jgi:tRNA nucleotidyltransferase/poly(A) polymerase